MVARTPTPGREDEFEAWMWQLARAAQHAPGYVDSTVQPPGDTHPDEWVVVYQFDSIERLEDWLDSSERSELIAAGDGLAVGPTREQTVAMPVHSQPVTVVSTFRVKPEHRSEWLRLQDQLDAALADWPGFVDVKRFEPVAGVQDETAVVFSFASREQLQTWFDSDVRAELLAASEPFVDGGRTVNVIGGFGGWFEYAEVPRWKQAAIVLLALYPLVLLLRRVSIEFLGGVWWPLALLITNVVSVAVMSWVLMPKLTRLFGPWLRSPSASARRRE